MRKLFYTLLSTCALGLFAATAQAVPSTGLVISELMFDPTGGNNNRQWVEIYNGTGAAVDLSTFSLGWGRNDYTQGVYQLSGVVPNGRTWVVGGPISDARNAFPTFDDASDLAPNLRPGTNNGRTDGVALFDVLATNITASSVPIHAVIYGRASASTVLLDESGVPGTRLFTTNGFSGGSSIEFWGGNTWLAQGTPTPGSVPAAIPEPGTATLLMLGLLALRATRGQRTQTA